MKRVFSHTEATELVSTTQWIKKYGLRSQKLSIQQVLPTIGFRHRRDRVPCLNKEVSAVHSLGLFPVYKDTDGSIYNICAGEARLTSIENRLTNLVTLYRSRLQWLTTRSQHVFGVVEESSVAIVVDRPAACDSSIDKLKNDLVTWSEEQLSRIARVNVFWCGGTDVNQWHTEATPVTPLSISSLTDWIIDRLSTTPSPSSDVPADKTAVLEAVLMAMADKKVESVYLVSNGNFVRAGEETFRRKVKSMRVRLHVVSYQCDDEKRMTKMKDMAVMTGGRFHIYPSIQPDFLLSRLSERSQTATTPNLMPPDIQASTRETRTASGHLSHSPQSSSVSNQSSHSTTRGAICEDVQLLFDELQRVLHNLAEIKALRHEIAGQKKPILTDEDLKSRSGSEEKPEEAMSSKEWLAKHSLKAKKLRFYDLVSTISFRHCEGVVDIKEAPNDYQSTSELVSHYKLVGAKYCGRFAHIRWLDGSVCHVFLSQFVYEQQKIRVMSLLESYRTRLAWLKRGSRELFGTVVEDQVIFLVDVSSSMENHLDIVKDKFEALLKEQLKFKSKFNVIQFGSSVTAWRDRLTEITPQTVHQLLQWVHSLVAGGSTNVGDALQLALADRDVQAVYLLTDGRPDQPPETILGQMQRYPLIPVHTIAFNCDDFEANCFLSKLAALTGGRYHYYSDDTRPKTEATRPYESEDYQLLREEIEQAVRDLGQMEELRAECAVLETKASPRRASQERKRLDSTTSHDKLGSRSYSSLSVSGSSRLRQSKQRASQPEVQLGHVTMKRQSPLKKLPPLTLSSKKWLMKHGLVAKRLTILHALEPALVEHKSSHVPVLNKDVVARVFDDVLPICHLSCDGKEVHLVNPLAVDLIAYEQQLGKAIALYERRLDQLVWQAIPDEEKQNLNLPGDPPSFRANRDILLECLDKMEWPISKQNITLLEQEINRGLVFMQQSHDLRMVSEKGEEASWQRHTPDGSLQGKLWDKKKVDGGVWNGMKKEVELQRSAKLAERYKGCQLIARDELTGLFFRGKAVNSVNSHSVEVQFSDGQCQVVYTKHIFEVGGARPCPVLRPGQYVLCGTQGPLDRDGDGQWEICHYYLPSIVFASPHNSSHTPQTPGLYTVINCFKMKITAHRRQLLLISQTQYMFAVRYLSQCQKPTIATDLFPTQEEQTEATTDDLLVDSATQTVNATDTANGQADSLKDDEQDEDMPELQGNSHVGLDSTLSLEQDVFTSSKFTVDSATQTISGTVTSSIQTECVEEETVDDSPEPQEQLKALMDLTIRLREKQTGRVKKELVNLVKVISQVQRKVSHDMQVEKQLRQSELRKVQQAHRKALAVMRDELHQLAGHKQLVVSEGMQVKEEQRQLSEKVTEIHKLLKDILDRLHELEKPALSQDHSALDPVQEELQDNGMLLIAAGDEGFVVSHGPLQVPIIEPAVVAKEDPMQVKVNSEVLARWPEDGWYYRVMVNADSHDGTFLVDDGSAYQRRLPRCDLISDEQDGVKTVVDGDCVVALHPCYSWSFAPGIVKGASSTDWNLRVEFYDGKQATLNREDVYWLDAEKYHQDVRAIEEQENSWVGQIVVARNDVDGLYYPAEVKEKIAGSRTYLIRWDSSGDNMKPPCIQDLRHLFGSLTTARELKTGDRVLATYSRGQTYVPGWVAALPTEGLDHVTINFCDGMRSTDIDKSSCFWLSQDYYDEVVEYLRRRQTAEQS